MKESKLKESTLGRENAIQELNRWFDEIGVPEDLRLDVDLGEDETDEEVRSKNRERDDIMRERVIRAIMSGNLILNNDNQLEYTLKEKILGKDDNQVVLEKLTFKNRYRTHELEAQMKGVKPDEFMPMIRAYVATLTGISKSILGRMYNRDTEVAQAIYNLFLRGEA
jgi:hypothetical protein